MTTTKLRRNKKGKPLWDENYGVVSQCQNCLGEFIDDGFSFNYCPICSEEIVEKETN